MKNVESEASLKLAGDRLNGPAIIEQFDSTIIALAGQTVSVDSKGTLLIEEEGTA